MNKDTLEALGLTADDVLERIAERVICEADLHDAAHSIVAERVGEEVEKGLAARIETTLRAEMERILDREIVPTNLWGEAEGEPTTIRNQLAARARSFWSEHVDKDGKKTTYSGKPRHQWVMDNTVREEFSKAVKENLELIVEAFRAAATEDAQKWITENLNKVLSAAGKGRR